MESELDTKIRQITNRYFAHEFGADTPATKLLDVIAERFEELMVESTTSGDDPELLRSLSKLRVLDALYSSDVENADDDQFSDCAHE